MRSLPNIVEVQQKIKSVAASHQFRKYIASGIIAFLVDFTVFRVLYINIGLELRLSTFLGILSGLTTGFLLQKLWAFKGKHNKKVSRQLLIYTILTIINTLFTEFVVRRVENLGIAHGAELGKVMASGLIILWNFAILKLVVFRKED